jgi:hypothetical protein
MRKGMEAHFRRRAALFPYRETEYNVKEYLPPIPRRDSVSSKVGIRTEAFLTLLGKWDKVMH